jgi:two-component system, NarL family, nitrate/nitrite response regulator NarL
VLSVPGGGLLRPQLDVFVLVAVRLYRDGIADALARDARFWVVGRCGALQDAESQLLLLPAAPAVTVVDLGLPEGAGAARSLRALWPDMSIVALGVPEVDADIVQLAEAGVDGLVTQDASLAELLDAVAAAVRNEALTTPTVAGVLLRRVASLAGEHRPTEDAYLTRREREIVVLISRGLSNKEIAQSLRIELSTVKNHVHNILEKLHVHRRAEAVSAARTRGGLDEI